MHFSTLYSLVTPVQLTFIQLHSHPLATIDQTCAKVPKRSEILGSLSPRSGNLMDLGPCASFLSRDSGNPGPQNFDMPQDPGNPGAQNLDMWQNPGNPEPRTSKYSCLETLKSLDATPFNAEFHAEHCAREFKR